MRAFSSIPMAPIHMAPIHSAPIHSAPIHRAAIHSAPGHGAAIHRLSLVGRLVMACALVASSACAGWSGPNHSTSHAWVTLLDDSKLDDWTRLGGANWRVVDGAVQADSAPDAGRGFLVSKDSYADFQLRAEVFVDATANSGIFIRCADPASITATTAYEVNIFDQRPDPTYGTGAIVGIAPVSPMPKAGGRWNTLEVIAQGPHLVVTLDGVRTVNIRNDLYTSGAIALQYGAGTVRFRKVEVRRL